MAMWDIYRREGPVIAIQSTVELLKQSVARYEKPVHIGEVKYVDWNDACFSSQLFAMCVRKELAYAHEAEIRALIIDFNGVGLMSAPAGLEVPFSPREFVTGIVIGPREKPWVANLVRLLASNHGLSQKVTNSNLLRPSEPT
jgi:hypothetical protein